MVATVVPVEPFDLVVFGATGDLAKRKLLPGLYHRLRDGQMPAGARVIGAARSQLSQEEFRHVARLALEEFVRSEYRDPNTVQAFLSSLDYIAVDAMGEGGWDELDAKLGTPAPDRVRAFYLSVAPSLFRPLGENLAARNLAAGEARLVLEKPIGHDLDLTLPIFKSVDIIQ